MNAGDRQPPDVKVDGTLIMSSDDIHRLTGHLTVVHGAAQLLLRRLSQGRADLRMLSEATSWPRGTDG